MAESFTFIIADKLLQKATSLVLDQVFLAGGVYTELQNLKATLSAVRAVTLDAEEQQVNNHQLTDWLGKLKDCFYDAEDVLDEFGYESLLREAVNEEGGGIRRKVRHFFSTSNPLAFRFKMGSKIKGIRERLDMIAADADKFNLKKIMSVPVSGPHGKREMTYSFVRASDIIGRDGDKDEIIRLLITQSSDDDDDDQGKKNVSVLPLVGIGGLGKTTLAKLVYNDERVVKHFDKRMWVCVSDEFDVTRLIKEIITCATHDKCDDLPLDELQLRLRNVLKYERFLLILDDVWSQNREKWHQLKGLIDAGAKRSQIIVTTRDKLVADVMGTRPMYEVRGLSDEECLSLFIRCAFKDGEDKRYPRLVGMGKDIAKKCHGVPLAVRTLGGMLYLKRDENDWVRVRDSETWQLEQSKDDILPALKLSYDELPLDVKRCFASCSLFPKDYEFNSIELISMWMGLGLIQPSQQNEEMEDIGNQYIDQLSQISFFQNVDDVDDPITDIGLVHELVMHDLVHDLALLLARHECSTLNFDSKNVPTKVRHVSMPKAKWPMEEVKVSRFFRKLNKNIRTILFPDILDGPRSELFVGISTVRRFKYIRVLDLKKSSFEALPHSVCNLKLLKYLDLSDNIAIKRLPNSICKLHHLQTLLLLGCASLEELPKHIGKMISLRHLFLTTQQIALLSHKKREVVRRCFNSLRILTMEDCDSLESLMEVEGMGSFAALTTLIIRGCRRLRSLPKHLLPALETLIIMDCVSLDLGLGNNDVEKDGDIRGFGSLRNLLVFALPKLEILPRWLIQGPTSNSNTAPLYLRIERCVNFRALWQEEVESLVNPTFLDTVVIRHCSRFSVLPEGIDRLVALRKLKITDCPQLSALPEKMRHLSALTHLTIEGCPILANRCKRGTGEDWNKISHVQHLYLDEESDSPFSKQLTEKLKNWRTRALSNLANRSVY